MSRAGYVARFVAAIAVIAVIPVIFFTVDDPPAWFVGTLSGAQFFISFSCGWYLVSVAAKRRTTKQRARWDAEDAAAAASAASVDGTAA